MIFPPIKLPQYIVVPPTDCEMKALSKEFKILIDNTSIKTPNINKLSSYMSRSFVSKENR
jgi:hypothetical protein